MSNIVKRVIVLDTLKEVSLSEKPRYALEQDTKRKVLQFFGLSYNAAFMSMVPVAVSQDNISVSIQVMNSVLTAHTLLRQLSSNPNAALATKIHNSQQS